MANRFNDSADSYSLTTLGAPHTLMAWVYIAVDTNSYSGIFVYNNGSQYFCGMDSTGTRLDFFNGGDNLGSEIAVGQWNHVAIVSGAGGTGTRVVYLNGVQDISTTGDDISGGTLFIGNSSGGLFLNGRMAAVKGWNSTLTQAQIQQEMFQYLPRRTTNLFGFWSFLTATEGTVDFSGNGNTLTSNGTPITEDGPPIRWSNGDNFSLPTIVEPVVASGGFYCMWEEIV